MSDKAYIVANEEQEREVLDKLEHGGFTWWGGDNLTENTPSKLFHTQFPYTIFVRKNTVTFNRLSKLEDEEIVYDGRKEKRMSEKYVVSQEFMNKLEEWKEAYITDTLDEKYHYVSAGDLDTLPGMIKDWWIEFNKPTENNNRLIAIIRWGNGEDVFEVEKPKKWVVRSKYSSEAGEHLYVMLFIGRGIKDTTALWGINNATKFDTKEEAQSWANSHQEVVEVEE